jgi:hypothetical protein
VVEDVAEGLRKAIRVLSEAREKLTNLVDFPGDESVSAVSTGEND